MAHVDGSFVIKDKNKEPIDSQQEWIKMD